MHYFHREKSCYPPTLSLVACFHHITAKVTDGFYFAVRLEEDTWTHGAFINSVVNLSEESLAQDPTHNNVISGDSVLLWTHKHDNTNIYTAH